MQVTFDPVSRQLTVSLNLVSPRDPRWPPKTDLTSIAIGKPEFDGRPPLPLCLPMIGSVPRMTRVVVTTGFGGNRITFSPIAAELVVGEILEHHDADWDLLPIS